MTLGQKIKRARKIALMDQAALAAKAGISASLVQKIENDRPGPSLKAKATVAKILSVPFDVEANIEPYSEQPLVTEPPLFVLKIHASRWDELRYEDDDAPVATKEQVAQGIFLARIRGDCMEPKWRDGQIVVFKLLMNESGRPNFESCESGRSYYVQMGDGRATFKAIEDCTDDEVVLMPLNPKYKKVRLRALKEDVARLAVAME